MTIIGCHREKDIHKLIHAKVHKGLKNLDNAMAEYAWRRNSEGE